jgi:hypothetical protein
VQALYLLLKAKIESAIMTARAPILAIKRLDTWHRKVKMQRRDTHAQSTLHSLK